MKKNKFLGKFLFLTLITVFTIIYIAINMGYFEYSNSRQKTLTDEQIKKFENKIMNGEQINLDDYIIHKSDINQKSGIVFSFSDKLSNISRKSIIEIFKMLNKFVDN